MARYTVYLRQEARGWEWSRNPDAAGWWGFYATKGRATAAAKRSINPVFGGKTNPKDWAFIVTSAGDIADPTAPQSNRTEYDPRSA